MERKYLAVLDNAGNAYDEFEYYSEHRNGSKDNMTDLKQQYKRTRGTSAYNKIIWSNVSTYLQD